MLKCKVSTSFLRCCFLLADETVDFRKGEDENIEFTLLRDDREIKLVIVFLESSDYPGSQIMCYAESEISTEIGNILSEITESVSLSLSRRES